MKVFTEAGEEVDGVLAFAVQDGLQSVTPSSGPARDITPLELAGYGSTLRTLNPTLNTRSQTINPKPSTLNPQPSTLISQP